uniref:TIR domain-containing protein n=1 Tax=Salix viminalis TaxID=40686 RepID=A0A6N2LJM4_SALVM
MADYAAMAIEGSRISVVVFSKNYASSRWCLDELVKIIECRQKIHQVVLPIFYDTDPSEVRKQTGSYAKAFDEHEEHFKEEMEKVNRWREALAQAGNLSGWGLNNEANGYEAELIKTVVNDVACKLGNKTLHVAKHPVGISCRVQGVISLLRGARNNVGIVGIHGIAGIGKTTIAKAVFNNLYSRFEGSSFLSDVKEISDKPNGLVELQERLLHDILKPNIWKISNVYEGMNLIEERFHRKNVLVVLDDVDKREQVEALMGERCWFGDGSKIIVVTKNKHLLTEMEVDGMYHAMELDPYQSLQLFSLHAFRETRPAKDYEELSEKVVDYYKGLPLALKILGSHLSIRDKAGWKIDIAHWQNIPHDDIQAKLRVSFDALDVDSSEIFLDIACFFVRKDKDYVADIVGERYGCHPEVSFRALIGRSLIAINNSLWMHDIVREMGREIIRQRSRNNPGNCSRIVLPKDAHIVLSKEMGTEAVEGLALDIQGSFSTKSFTKMKHLQLLQITGAVHLVGSYSLLPRELIWLYWPKCPLKSLPSDFHLSELVMLDMQGSKVQKLWKGTKRCKNLLSISELPSSVLLLRINDCTSIERVSAQPQHERMLSLCVAGCRNLIEIQGMEFAGNNESYFYLDHLYSALIQAGIHTFRDDNELPRGEEISPQLLRAIEGSRISVVVFSTNYASSRWCLDELVKIIECRQKIHQVVLPIFYHTDPSDIRKQTGSYAKAFDEHEEHFKEEMEKAANLSGWGLNNEANGYEAELIKRVVNDVACKLGNKTLHVAKHPVGISSKVRGVISLLKGARNNVGIVGIYGIAGIGKTTIAKAVFNNLYFEFEGNSFLSGVKEISDKPNGLVELQERLLHDILKPNVWKISNVYEGMNLIKERLHRKNVLVVLDDVDKREQVEALMGERCWFGDGSKIIIVTKNKHLLTEVEVDGMYHARGLDRNWSLQLFSLHAFRETRPEKDYEELSEKVVDYCKGLPLALEVLGSHLSIRDKAGWKIDIAHWQNIPYDDIQAKLRVSFDALDVDSSEIFLDIACFFVGKDKDYVADIVGARYGCHPEVAFRALIGRSLIAIDTKNRNSLWMHDIVRKMGREIIRQRSRNHPGNCSRIVLPKDAYTVLSKEMGTDAVEGLALDVQGSFSTKSFTKMRRLQLIQITGAHLAGSYSLLPRDLIWLCWPECPLKSLPSDFHIGELVILVMQGSKVRKLWKGTKSNGAKLFPMSVKVSFDRNSTKHSWIKRVPLIELEELLQGVEELELNVERLESSLIRELPKLKIIMLKNHRKIFCYR